MLSRFARGLSENLPVLGQKQEQTCAASRNRILGQTTENTTKFVALKQFLMGKIFVKQGLKHPSDQTAEG